MRHRYGEDKVFVEQVFNDTRRGTAKSFLDIGCNDGVAGSNTWHFEMKLGWKGKCIECPECENQAVVWHFAWSALTCSECEVSYPKYEWKIAACELS